MANTQSLRLASRQAEAEAEFLTLTESATPHDGATTVPLSVSTAEEALELMHLSPVDILLTDLGLPGSACA